jgi:hypothetical protein
VSDEGGPAKEEDCIAPWGSAIVQKSDFAGLRKFIDDIAKSSAAMGGGNGREMLDRFDKYPGFPVTRHPLEAGMKQDEQLKSAKRGSVPASAFVPPAGYTKKELQMGAMGGPHGNFKPLPPPQQ